MNRRASGWVAGLAMAVAAGCGPQPSGDSPGTVESPPITEQNANLVPAWPPLETSVDHYELDFDDATAAIVYDPARGKVLAPGFFTAGGTRFEVMLRQRGQGARSHPKHSWKVKLAEGEEYLDTDNFNLLAEYLDAGYLSDHFSYNLMRAAGVAASASKFVTLTVNGEFQGIYVQVEDVNKRFLKQRGIDKGSNIYRCGTRDCELKITPRAWYQKPWENKTVPGGPHPDLDQFLREISRTPEGELEAYLARHLDLDGYLRSMAVNALISNVGVDDSGSYLVHDLTRDRWTYVPWDLNNSAILFWRTEALDSPPRVTRPIPVFTAYDWQQVKTYEWKEQKYGGAHMPWSVLSTRIWDRPALRNRVLDLIEQLMATAFSPEQANPRIQALDDLVSPLYPKDPWVDLAHAKAHAGYLRRYVQGRIDFLRKEIPKQRRHGEGGVVINAIAAPGGRLTDERGSASAFVELYNREDKAFDLSGATFTDHLRTQFKHRLPAGLSVPAKGKLVLWLDGRPDLGPTHLPFVLDPSGGELGLFDGQSMVGVIDLTFFGPMNAGQEYRRAPDGSEDWGWR